MKSVILLNMNHILIGCTHVDLVRRWNRYNLSMTMYSQMLGVYEYWITFAEMMYMYVDIVKLKKKWF